MSNIHLNNSLFKQWFEQFFSFVSTVTFEQFNVSLLNKDLRKILLNFQPVLYFILRPPTVNYTYSMVFDYLYVHKTYCSSLYDHSCVIAFICICYFSSALRVWALWPEGKLRGP